MKDAKCPACRRRFSATTVVCERCGADLTLLVALRRRSVLRALTAFCGPEMTFDDRAAALEDAQQLCRSKVVCQLLNAMRGKI